jgi:uncharacterized protein YukJ
MAQLNNTDPAARALTILQRGMQTAPKRSILHFWATAFAVDPKNMIEIYYNLGLLRDLANDIERRVNQIPGIKHEQYLKPVLQLRTTIAQANLQGGMAATGSCFGNDH